MPTTLCITGMHRSGTSLTASWLAASGLVLHNGRVSGTEVGNPKGHYEDLDFVRLHQNYITSRYPKSLGWKVALDKPLRFDDVSLNRARSLIQTRSAKYSMWGWKDPRSVLFLQQWKELLPEMKVMLLWRPSALVIDSLLRRSRKSTKKLLKVSIFEAASLWVHYNELIKEFRLLYPTDTVLLPIEFVINHNGKVAALLKERFGLELAFNPIHQLFDPHLLNSTRVSSLVRLLSVLSSCQRLELALEHLSDGEV